MLVVLPLVAEIPLAARPVEAAGASLMAMREGMAELFASDEDRLRLPAEHVGALFLSLLFTRSRDDGSASPDAEALVDVFPHGAVIGR